MRALILTLFKIFIKDHSRRLRQIFNQMDKPKTEHMKLVIEDVIVMDNDEVHMQKLLY